MNEIKIYLKSSGSTAELYKDFNLYRGSYQNVKISVYVPKGLLYSREQDYFLNSVNTAGILISPSGEKITTKNFPAGYEKDASRNGVEYSVYTQLMPKEYCVYTGTQTIVCNVINIDNTEKESPRVLSVTTSQTVPLTVNESAYVSEEELLDPTDVQVINGRINALAETTEVHTEQISTLEKKVANNTANIKDNTVKIAENKNDIDYLYQHMAKSEEYIGEMSGGSLPTDEQLTAFVQSNTSPSRAPENGDVIMYILTSGGTNRTYKYIYTLTGWVGYELPSTEPADNNRLGLIKGSIGGYSTLTVNISGGEILEIFYKDKYGEEKNLKYAMDSHQTSIENINAEISKILSGATVVGAALRDGSGNLIESQYLSKYEGASKQFVRDYALPRFFNDVYYIYAGGYKETPPTTPANGIQFTKQTSAAGTFSVFGIQKLLEKYEYEFTQKNSATNVIWISANKNITVEFKLTTSITNRETGEVTTLSVQLSGEVSLVADNITKITFDSNFSSLGTGELKVNPYDYLNQWLEVITTDSTPTVFDVYSNEMYPGSFTLNINTSSGGGGGTGGGTVITINGTPQETYDATNVVKRNSGGGITVPDPTNSEDASNKKYVDQNTTTRMPKNTIYIRQSHFEPETESNEDIRKFATYSAAYINSAIDNVEQKKINKTDIVNNLTSSDSTKPLSAAQGKVLKGMVDNLSGSLPVQELNYGYDYFEFQKVSDGVYKAIVLLHFDGMYCVSSFPYSHRCSNWTTVLGSSALPKVVVNNMPLHSTGSSYNTDISSYKSLPLPIGSEIKWNQNRYLAELEPVTFGNDYLYRIESHYWYIELEYDKNQNILIIKAFQGK